MGRKPSEKNYELTIENSDKKFKLFHIKTPFPVNIRVKPKPATPDAIIGNTSFIHTIPRFYSEREEIIKESRENGIEILSVEQLTFMISEICPRCGNKGVPSIRQKNTDYTYTTNEQGQTFELTTQKGVGKQRPYWLTFKHGEKRCWVRQWQGTNQGTFKQTKKGKQIDPRKFTISEPLKKLARN